MYYGIHYIHIHAWYTIRIMTYSTCMFWSGCWTQNTYIYVYIYMFPGDQQNVCIRRFKSIYQIWFKEEKYIFYLFFNFIYLNDIRTSKMKVLTSEISRYRCDAEPCAPTWPYTQCIPTHAHRHWHINPTPTYTKGNHTHTSKHICNAVCTHTIIHTMYIHTHTHVPQPYICIQYVSSSSSISLYSTSKIAISQEVNIYIYIYIYVYLHIRIHIYIHTKQCGSISHATGSGACSEPRDGGPECSVLSGTRTIYDIH